jgi:hypothetical protein
MGLESGLVPKNIRRDAGGLGMFPSAPQEISRMHECVGFDEERVLLLREKEIGTQLLECYDFT